MTEGFLTDGFCEGFLTEGLCDGFCEGFLTEGLCDGFCEGFLIDGLCDGLYEGGPGYLTPAGGDPEGGHGGSDEPAGTCPGAALLINGANEKAIKSKFSFIAKLCR